MSSHERMDALLQYCKPDRVPINMIAIGFPCRNAGHPIAAAYNDPEKNFQALTWSAEQYGWDLIPLSLRHTVLGALDFGGKVRLPEGQSEGAMVVEAHPVKEAHEVDKLKMPDPKTAGHVETAMRFAEVQEALGLQVSFVSRSPLSMASNICGLDTFCRWMMKEPELCHRLMDMSLVHILNVLQYWVDSFSAENLFVFMTTPCESNQVISPKHFEKFALSYHEAYHNSLKAMKIKRFFMHVCGDQNQNLPGLAGLAPWPHPSILSFGHEVDLEVAAKYFPEDIMYGNVEPAVIQTNSPQQVYELTRIAIEKGKKAQGGFVLSAGCELPPLAPPANVFAMTKAVNDFGWYE